MPQSLDAHTVDDAKRRQILDHNVRDYFAQGYQLETRSEFDAVIYKVNKANHVLHGIITLFTCLTWGIVWIVVAACTKNPERHSIWVDEYGVSHIRRIKS